MQQNFGYNGFESGGGLLAPLGSSSPPDPQSTETTSGEEKGKNQMNTLILQFRKVTPLCLIVCALGCLAPPVQAVVPPPDGGYPNFTTAEGDHALQALTTGVGNTAIGNFSLFSVTTGNFNTAVGALSLDLNTADSNTATGAAALLFNTTGTENTANGTAALEFNDTGSQNTANGAFALFSNTTGSDNVATGFQALFSNTTGTGNTAMGFGALFSNTTVGVNVGGSNTAIGFQALVTNTTGFENTAVGYKALLNNETSNFTTAVGAFALQNNISPNNTAAGFGALTSNTTGDSNTAVGSQALASNTQGGGNTAVGGNALASNLGAGNSAFGIGALQAKQLGGLNTAMGDNALFSLTGLSAMNSNNNTALGALALFSLTAGDSNTAVGLEAGQHLTTGNSNTIMGFQAGTNLTTGAGNIYIASPGAASESNTIRIGNAQVATFIAGINGVDEGSPTAVFINTTTGQLGTIPPPSSRQYKKEIKPMDKVSETILALKPVTFHYKSDHAGTPQFGLIAEEVAEVNPDLILRDNKGDVYSVRYDAVNAMLLNEFLKEHRKVQEQEAMIAQLKSTLAKKETIDAHQQEQIEALTAGLEKVSAQLEASKPAPQTVLNDH